jgi:hypothetical protein
LTLGYLLCRTIAAVRADRKKEQIRHPSYRDTIHELDLTQVNEPQEII